MKMAKKDDVDLFEQLVLVQGQLAALHLILTTKAQKAASKKAYAALDKISDEVRAKIGDVAPKKKKRSPDIDDYEGGSMFDKSTNKAFTGAKAMASRKVMAKDSVIAKAALRVTRPKAKKTK